VAWCAATAFLLGHGGELTLDGWPALVRLTAFLAAAAVGSGIARLARARRPERPHALSR
jgi:hypothetical protein